jgi:phosphatidylglycerol lysyltransferase
MMRKRIARGQAIAATLTIARPRFLMRFAVFAAITALFLALLRHRLASIEYSEVLLAFGTVSAGQWGLAAGASCLSFWAVGHYDATVHRHLRTGIPAATARRAGMAAIAVSQTLGMGVLTGAIVRWRMLPGIGLWQATRLSLSVTLSFLLGWSLVTALVFLALPAAPMRTIAGIVAGFGAMAALVCVIQPRLRLWGRDIRCPNLFTLARILVFALVDTLCAAIALHALCPPDLALPFATLLPAFLIALGAGLVSGTPGGVGAFEVALLAMLPEVPDSPLLAAVLAFRLVYFAAPAVIGAAIAAVGPRLHDGRAGTGDQDRLSPRLHPSAPAEAQLVRQGELSLIPLPDGAAWLGGRTAHSLVALLDPFPNSPAPDERASRPSEAAMIRALRAQARSAGLIPCLYKCSARMAARARQDGMIVRRIAREAVVHPPTFTVTGATMAQLRRKLRRAETAGVAVARVQRPPFADLSAIAAHWAAARGGERGFSMGRYSADLVAGQRVYVARVGGRVVAFATFHEGAQDWTLDLMRHHSDAPDGTMHTIVATAIAEAAHLRVPRLSLAAVSEPADSLPLLARRAIHRVDPDAGAGLLRFKAAFNPRWHPLYIAAPSQARLTLAAIEIARAVHWPAALPRHAVRNGAHDDLAQFEFASQPGSWHR